MRQIFYGVLALCALLGACNSDNNSNSNAAPGAGVTSPSEVGGGTLPTDNNGGTVTPPVTVAPSRFNIANACYALQSMSTGKFVTKNSDGSYQASASTAGTAAPFYMKPTALGKYMLYTADKLLMQASTNASGSPVGSSKALDDKIEWTVLDDTQGRSGFQLLNTATDKKLADLPSIGKLGLVEKTGVSDQTVFQFVPATGCTDYPEIGTNSTGDTFKGQGVDKPVKGFADVHNHITATFFLGGAHHGLPYSKFGVTKALDSCQADHGPDGRLDLVGNLFAGTPQATHSVNGWPTFDDWPAYASLTHEGLYYTWLERAWKAGLRIFVTDLVENETLCNLVVKTKGKPTQDCNEMDSAIKQIQFARDMESYIDAQSGGPGKGWFRIVTSPKQARQVINDGKLAVVLGIEISHLFNCTVKNGQPGCTQADIDKQLDKLYALGVRQMFPIHEFNNAFGGNGIFNGDVLNGGNFLDTGAFWQTYDCPKEDYLYTAGAIMTTVPGLGNDPVTQAVIANNPGVLPLYNSQQRQCNKRGLTPLGQYLFKRLMEKGIIIEVDHMELSIKQALIDMSLRQSPTYPVVSTHGGHGGLSTQQAKQILAGGGLIYPFHHNGQEWVKDLQRIREFESPNYPFAVGYGADTNGLGTQAGPRGADRPPVQYPFTLFKGQDWQGVFNGDVQPVTFDQQKSGEHIYDVNRDGQANYGLKADWVEAVRKEGGNDALKALYNSAEVYIQVWERTLVKRDQINP